MSAREGGGVMTRMSDAAVIAAHYGTHALFDSPGEWVASVMEALRENRTVRTVEELDALPVGTMIRCGFGVIREAVPRWKREVQAWTGRGDLGLPALILWLPEDGE